MNEQFLNTHEHTMEHVFLNLQEKQTGSKTRELEKSKVKLQCLAKKRETTFDLRCREVTEIEFSQNLDSTLTIWGEQSDPTD